MFQKLSRIIGFTETELKVILFLGVILLIGIFYKEYFKETDTSEYVEYDYSAQDSSFNYYLNSPDEYQTKDTISKNKNDIKREVLEFDEQKIIKKNKSTPLTENSININSATKDQLLLLPGIGEKTADNIIAYRDRRKKFSRLEELLEVKGIGESKFNKIKKFLYIELKQ